MRRFKELTWGHPVVMGRSTWESLPDRFRPLPGRANLVLTREAGWAASSTVVVHSPDEALVAAEASGLPGPLWVIGGGQVYRAFEPRADRAEVTVIDLSAQGDTHAPTLGPTWRMASREPQRGWATSATALRYRFETWLQETSP
ncbi:MAG: dihydrofolate reductase, partial [Bifidobacteriaceae bacterium]|jgi:dihydrofolate reductase|nr:dihydrofolate reductase [Bifidobacteriaceae bacterium]